MSAKPMVTTRNEAWGFYGALNARDAGVIYDSAARALMERYALGADEARDLLDSTTGRHMADERAKGEGGADLVARLSSQRGWATTLRRAVQKRQPRPVTLRVQIKEIAVLRFALDNALSQISEAHAEDRAQIKALIERLEAAQR